MDILLEDDDDDEFVVSFGGSNHAKKAAPVAAVVAIAAPEPPAAVPVAVTSTIAVVAETVREVRVSRFAVAAARLTQWQSPLKASNDGAFAIEADLNGPSISLFPLANFTFGSKGSGKEHRTLRAKMARRKQLFESEGTRNSVSVVLLTNHRNHPHLLLLRSRDADTKEEVFSLPTARLLPGEDATRGVSRCLAKRCQIGLDPAEWEVATLLGRCYRPEFDRRVFPYCPPHVTSPKEVMSVYLMHMPSRCTFMCSAKYDMVAIPVVELYHQVKRFGEVVSMLPLFLSRCSFIMEEN